MSWTESFTNVAAADVATLEPYNAATGEAREQFDAARASAVSIVESGAVGTPDDLYNVSLYGHANPDHRPREQWANDGVTVVVTQAAFVQAAAAA